jgi:hypothetical protein
VDYGDRRHSSCRSPTHVCYFLVLCLGTGLTMTPLRENTNKTSKSCKAELLRALTKNRMTQKNFRPWLLVIKTSKSLPKKFSNKKARAFLIDSMWLRCSKILSRDRIFQFWTNKSENYVNLILRLIR